MRGLEGEGFFIYFIALLIVSAILPLLCSIFRTTGICFGFDFVDKEGNGFAAGFGLFGTAWECSETVKAVFIDKIA